MKRSQSLGDFATGRTELDVFAMAPYFRHKYLTL
jgi:hypothetical protein